MTYRMRVAGAALAVAMLIGSGSVAVAGPKNGEPNNCFGQHVSYAAQHHGGMAAATDQFNQNPKHDDMTVGEHMEFMREKGCDWGSGGHGE
jgi:hypothetical protein